MHASLPFVALCAGIAFAVPLTPNGDALSSPSGGDSGPVHLKRPRYADPQALGAPGTGTDGSSKMNSFYDDLLNTGSIAGSGDQNMLQAYPPQPIPNNQKGAKTGNDDAQPDYIDPMPIRVQGPSRLGSPGGTVTFPRTNPAGSNGQQIQPSPVRGRGPSVPGLSPPVDNAGQHPGRPDLEVLFSDEGLCDEQKKCVARVRAAHPHLASCTYDTREAIGCSAELNQALQGCTMTFCPKQYSDTTIAETTDDQNSDES